MYCFFDSLKLGDQIKQFHDHQIEVDGVNILEFLNENHSNELNKIKFIKQFDNVNIDSILIFPFYPQVNQYNKVTKLKNSFIYPSTGYSYKNHFNLINHNDYINNILY